MKSKRAQVTEAFARVTGVGFDARPATCARYQIATFATQQTVLAVLRPRTVAQVQGCLRIAQRKGIALYPVSQGKNWGYGCRVPVTSGAVVLDLAGLNRISDLDEQLGTVRVEPGVTFAQLEAYLRRRRSTLMAPVIGSSTEASVLANALERGLGIGLAGLRAEHTLGLEVVTARGERVLTGSAAISGSRVAAAYRAGLGPCLDGLFFQSNLGVVTAAHVWLHRRPRYFATVDLSFTPRQFPATLGALREAHEAGELRGMVKVTNSTNEMVSSYFEWRAQLPEGIELPRPMLPPHQYWQARLAVLAVTLDEARCRLRWLRRRFRPLVPFYRATQPRPTGAIKGEGYLGSGAESALWPAYWKASPPRPATPDLHRDLRGALFCSPVIPFRPRELLGATQLFSKICLRAGFEPVMTLNAADARAVCMVGSIYFDRAIPGEDARALACHAAAQKALREKGYPPYRLGIQSMKSQGPRLADTDRVLGRIARALDPAGILAPGRYLGRARR